jgi:hypothetical protein
MKTFFLSIAVVTVFNFGPYNAAGDVLLRLTDVAAGDLIQLLLAQFGRDAVKEVESAERLRPLRREKMSSVHDSTRRADRGNRSGQ